MTSKHVLLVFNQEMDEKGLQKIADVLTIGNRSPVEVTLLTYPMVEAIRAAMPKAPKPTDWAVSIEGMALPWQDGLTQAEAQQYAEQFRQNGIAASADQVSYHRRTRFEGRNVKRDNDETRQVAQDPRAWSAD